MHYRPVEDDFWLKIKNHLFKFLKKIRPKLCRKRKVTIVKSKTVYQLQVWRKLRTQLHTYLNDLIAGKNVPTTYFQQLLRPLNLESFMCVEQAVQIAFLETLRYFNLSELTRIQQFAESFNIEDKGTIVPFLFELKRALQWTFALRIEWDLHRHNKRQEPRLPLENNAELVFK